MIIDGKQVAQKIKDEIKNKIAKQNIYAKLCVVMVGNNSASAVYVRNKRRACEYVGIDSEVKHFDENISEEELISHIRQLNDDISVSGILVQLPLPKHIDEEKVIEIISPDKDVDGFHPENVGKLSIGLSCHRPCTPSGIIFLLEEYNVDICGKNVVVMGRSNIVGKPISMMLLEKDATVTVVHSKTKNLREITKRADILVVALGKARMIDESYIKNGAVVIDVGINHDETGKLCGDVDFDRVKDKVSLITPVPGGVGPMTIAMLLYNCIQTFER